MMYISTLLASTILGIDWIKILIHFVVLVVLIVGLGFLVYKPVLRFIRHRQETIQQQMDDSAARAAQADEVKQQYEERLAASDREAQLMLEQARSQSDAIVETARAEAQRDAEAIRQQAAQEAEAARLAAAQEVRTDITQLAVDIAGQLIDKHLTIEDDDQLISQCLEAWSDNHD